MSVDLAQQIVNKATKACKAWSDVEEADGEIILYPIDKGAPVLVDIRLVFDGLEAFAEFSLRHEDAKFRDVARKIKREQYGSIKLNNKIVSSIIQYGAFGEELF